jgi:hypothetical protein
MASSLWRSNRRVGYNELSAIEACKAYVQDAGLARRLGEKPEPYKAITSAF